MSTAISLIGASLLGVILAGYYAQQYLPAPPSRVVGVDLGTTFSSIGVYHAVSGKTIIIPDDSGRFSIPSIVTYFPNGSSLAGWEAQTFAESHSESSIYDAKRFMGKTFVKDEFWETEQSRYPFQIELDDLGRAYFNVKLENDKVKNVIPEEIGGLILHKLLKLAEKVEGISIKLAVISVPAEFEEAQRNATKAAAALAGLDVLRVISEPTAAALAFGLHEKSGVQYIMVVDLGGGTLDVSILWLQGGMFITRAMAGNNRLGGQDFNHRVLQRLLNVAKEGGLILSPDDMQHLRTAIEQAKLTLTTKYSADIVVPIANKQFKYKLTRDEFESLNEDLLLQVLEPVRAALVDAEMDKDEIDEIVLVGGSTRIPRVRDIVGQFFGKAANFGVDPELAVVTGVAVQAGVLGGGWPLRTAAIELPPNTRKTHIYSKKSD